MEGLILTKLSKESIIQHFENLNFEVQYIGDKIRFKKLTLLGKTIIIELKNIGIYNRLDGEEKYLNKYFKNKDVNK